MQRLIYLINTFFWYLKRPQLYPQFIRKIWKKMSGSQYQHNSDDRAKILCNEHAIETSDAIHIILNNISYSPFKEKFKTEITRGKEIVNKCQVQMGGESNLDLLYYISYFQKPSVIVETGVAYGWSSLAFLLSIKDNDKAILFSNDMPYQNRNNDKYVGCVVLNELKKKWILVNQPDRDALPKTILKVKAIDIAHYDSDKSYEGRIWGCSLLWKALKKGGCLIMDDIEDNMAFFDFCNTVNRKPYIIRSPKDIPEKFTGVIFK